MSREVRGGYRGQRGFRGDQGIQGKRGGERQRVGMPRESRWGMMKSRKKTQVSREVIGGYR